MGTEASLVMVGDRCDEALVIVASVFRAVTAKMSPWDKDSDVTRLNASAGRFVAVDASTLTVLQRARELARKTDGLFDITFAPAAALWESGANVAPDARKIEQALGVMGYQHVQLAAGKARIRRPGTQISLNGIAKGWAVDEAVKALRAAGHRHFVLRAGGDLFASGTRGDRPWIVAIRDPRDKTETFAELPIEDAAFSTSGDYERGKHIIDPRTAKPADASRSATVKSADCTTAEALTKALFILGKDGLDTLLPRFAGAEAVIVDRDNVVFVSKGLRQALKRTRPPTP
jgi:thiamine biosynthesis lipoprotein